MQRFNHHAHPHRLQHFHEASGYLVGESFLNLKTNTGPAWDGGTGSVDPRFKLSPPPDTQVQDFTMGVGAQPKP